MSKQYETRDYTTNGPREHQDTSSRPAGSSLCAAQHSVGRSTPSARHSPTACTGTCLVILEHRVGFPPFTESLLPNPSQDLPLATTPYGTCRVVAEFGRCRCYGLSHLRGCAAIDRLAAGVSYLCPHVLPNWIVRPRAIPVSVVGHRKGLQLLGRPACVAEHWHCVLGSAVMPGRRPT